ncbi:E3 ubiquitin-protein ligase NEURL3 [Lates japonicus]
MVKENDNRNSVVGSEMPHRCGLFCLGPLTFHSQAVGDKVRLSEGGRLAERTGATFRNGLVLSSRPVKIQERIRLRVEKDLFTWHGALRVGFTNVPPSDRSLPLPPMAIPNLTDTPGHWAAPVHESCCREGSELEFWVSYGGTIYVSCNNNCTQHKLLTGVDLREPLWAMIDIYGQTCSIFLLGSEKRGVLRTRKSCPAPERLPSPVVDNLSDLISNLSAFSESSDESIPWPDGPAGEDCVVCMRKKVAVTLPCGHRCLCVHCTPRIIQQFGTCPLCRHVIRAPSDEGPL